MSGKNPDLLEYYCFVCRPGFLPGILTLFFVRNGILKYNLVHRQRLSYFLAPWFPWPPWKPIIKLWSKATSLFNVQRWMFDVGRSSFKKGFVPFTKPSLVYIKTLSYNH